MMGRGHHCNLLANEIFDFKFYFTKEDCGHEYICLWLLTAPQPPYWVKSPLLWDTLVIPAYQHVNIMSGMSAFQNTSVSSMSASFHYHSTYQLIIMSACHTIHAYQHYRMHISISAFQHSSILACKYINISAFQHSNNPAFQHSSIPALHHVSMSAFHHSSIPACQHISMPPS